MNDRGKQGKKKRGRRLPERVETGVWEIAKSQAEICPDENTGKGPLLKKNLTQSRYKNQAKWRGGWSSRSRVNTLPLAKMLLSGRFLL